MKKIKNHIPALVVVAFITLLLGSCDDSFLEITPKGRLIAAKTSDYDKLLNTNELINYSVLPLSVPLGDEVIARNPFFSARPNLDQRLFRYEDDIYEPTDVPSQLTALTRTLYLFNKIINEVMDSEGGTDQEKRMIRAEALTGRAWVYLHYTNLFTKPYNPSTAASDPGFPVISEADINKSPYVRGTLEQTYQFMIDDLTTAIPDLPAIITSRHRASKALAQSFLGKVLLTMGRYSDALTHLNGAIATIESNTGVFVGIYDFNVEMLAGGALFSASMANTGPAQPTLSNNIQNIYGRQDINANASSANNYFVLAPAVVALYGADDMRRRYYNATNLAYPAGSLRKIGPTFQPSGLTIPEIYLMRAECRARTNLLYGPGSAAEDLLYLRIRRMPAASAAILPGMTQTQMIEFVINERLREFAFTGLRWFDMRRLSVDPLFSNRNYVHTLYNADGSTEAFPLRPERLVLRIPSRIIDDNPGMENNP